jgi:pyruvate kinase
MSTAPWRRWLRRTTAGRDGPRLDRGRFPNLEKVLGILSRLTGNGSPCVARPPDPVTARQGQEVLTARAEALLGPARKARPVRIMVTLPTEAASRYELVRDLVLAGMDCARINCAHDGRTTWEGMIANLRRAESEAGRSCRLLMDIAGPRARTGPLAPGPPVLKVAPVRDSLGWVVRPAEVLLTPEGAPDEPPADADATLPLPADFLAELHPGDRLRFSDTRNASRSLTIVGEDGANRWARLSKTAYFASGMRLRRRAGKEARGPSEGRVGALPPTERKLYLRAGDQLVLTSGPEPGAPPVMDRKGRITAPARLPVVPPEVFDSLRAEERVSLDEGRVLGVIRSVEPGQALVEVTGAPSW